MELEIHLSGSDYHDELNKYSNSEYISIVVMNTFNSGTNPTAIRCRVHLHTRFLIINNTKVFLSPIFELYIFILHSTFSLYDLVDPQGQRSSTYSSS